MKRAAAFCIAAALSLHAQPRTVIQTETRLVVVDAVVTGKKGDRIPDLTKKDFHVWEDNKEQALQMFSFETNPATTEAQRLILFFDDQSLKAEDQVRARHAAANFIDAHLEKNRLMAVVDFDGTLRVAQNFTDNAGRLKDAVNGTHYGGITSGASTTTTAATAASISDQNARGLMGVIGTLARNLSAVPGRKIIVVISAGAPAASDPSHDIDAAVQACNRSNTGVYVMDLSDPTSLPAVGTAETAGTDSPSAGRMPARMSPIATRGMQTRSADAAIDGRALAAVAQGSGGFVVHNTNDLLRGLQDVGKEENEYYVLGYTPPESKEGSCHNLRVKVDRGGATVRARSSYCSTKAQDILAGSTAAKDLETRAAAAQSGNVNASMQAPFFYIAPNVARVRVAMEFVPDALKFEVKNGKSHAELNVLGIASTADGDIAARFSDAVKLDVDDKRAPVRYEKEFKIAPGQYKFTVVFSSGGAGFGKLEAPLVIEPYDRTGLALGGIVFSKEAHPVSNLGLDAGLFEDTTPLIANGVEFVPATSNQFRKGDLALFYAELYAPGTGETGIRMRILDRKSGEQKLDSGAMKIDRPKTAGAAIPLGQKLPVSDLAPGSYTLELTAIDAEGKSFRRSADFEVR